MGAGVETAAAAGGDGNVAAMLVVAVVWVACFSWLAVVGWAIQRRKEREAYYRHETEKRLLEKGEAGATQILRLRHEEERTRWLRRREGLRLGGVITTALGISLLVGLQFIDTGELSLAGTGGIPLIIGLALLLYAYVFYPKFTEFDSDTLPLSSDERGGDQHD